MKARAASVAALAALWLPFAVGAVLVFPMWDDGWLWMLIDEQGPGAIPAAFSDRPVNGWFWRLQASNAVFWIAQLTWHALLWPLTAWLAARLYRELPASAAHRWLAACLVVAPLFTTVQMIAANVATASLLPVTLAYASALALVAYVRRGRRAALALALPLGALGVLYQEYAIPVMGIAVVLVARDLWPGGDGASRRRALVACVATLGVTVASYGLFLRLAAKWRSDVQPGHALDQGFARLPAEVVEALTRGLGAAFVAPLRRFSEAPVAALPIGLALGAAVAVALLAGLRAARDEADAVVEGAAARPAERVPAWGVAVVALVVGLVPVVAMGRRPWDPADGMSSRFALPVLPVLAVLVARAVAALPGRARTAAVVALALLMGTSTVCDVASALHERRRLANLGTVLGVQLARDPMVGTAAVVPVPERAAGPPRQWELAARLAWSWPGELRRQFWAHRFGGGHPSYPEEATVVFGPRDGCRPPYRFNVDVRRLQRHGPIERVLWVADRPDGTVDIEPYCRPAGLSSAPGMREADGRRS